MAVMCDPSMIATGVPVTASTSAITAWMVGIPRSRLPGKVETSFTAIG
jgi:hypothetical protein